MYSDNCKIASKCASLGAIEHRGLSLLRKMNGSMDSAKYQSDIIHDIEMTCECVVFPQTGYIFIHDTLTYMTLKVLENSKNVKKYHSGMIREFARYQYHREPLKYNEEEIGDQMPCKKEMWKQVCEAWYNVAPNALEELNNSIPRRIAGLIKVKGDATKY